MLRTIVVRNENLLRGSIKRAAKVNSLRCLSYECARKFQPQRALQSSSKVTRPAVWNLISFRGYCSNLPSHTRVTLPALSPTMELGTIVSWEKKVGDKLNEGDLLAEIETDKATMGFETPEEGYLAKILVQAGEKDIPIGKLVCVIVENESDVAAFTNFTDSSPPAGKPAAAAPQTAAAPPAATPPPIAAAPAAPRPLTAVEQRGPRVYASPMAKRLAEAQSLRLDGQGSGAFGSITSKDLSGLSAAGPAVGGAPPAPISVPAGAAYVDIPVSNTRAVIAKRLLESKVTIPHYYLTVDINIDKLTELRAKFNKKLEKEGVKLSLNDFIIKAVAHASRKVPEANSSWHGSFIRQYDSVDCSVAVATDKGLITPIVPQADRKGVVEINKSIKSLVAKARDGKLQPHEFQGGTITVSNLGMFGITHFSAVINPPQSCILAVGGLQPRIIPDKNSEKGWKQSDFISVTLSCDHRTVDGAVGAKWLQHFQQFLEDPHTLLL